MSSTTTQPAATPRAVEAWNLFKALPEADRTYANVSQAMGVTEQRAGVYCREGAAAANEEHLLPRRGRKSTGGGARTRKLPTFLANLKGYVDSAEAYVNGLREAISNLDGEVSITQDDWVASEVERLDTIAKEARAAATAFAKDSEAQAKAFVDHVENVTKRNADLKKTKEDALDEAEAQLAEARETFDAAMARHEAKESASA